jgi:hypothetical protein
MQASVELIMKHNLFNLPLQYNTLDPDISRLKYKLRGARFFLRG